MPIISELQASMMIIENKLTGISDDDMEQAIETWMDQSSKRRR